MSRIAVIGSGISGLSAAYYLSRKHEVFLFERDSRLGGHTHTVNVTGPNGPIPVDTGFIVHNDRTYPNLIRLLRDLNVPRVDSDMSFAVSCQRSGYEYSSRGLNGFFAQRGNVFSAKPYRLYAEIRRFNREAPAILRRADAETLQLGDFLDERHYSQEFRNLYLSPMAAAVWSCAPGEVKNFPAAMLVRFFENHGMLTTNGHPQWKTIPGGCSSYIAPITKPLHERITTGVTIQAVERDEQGITLRFRDERADQRYDHVIFATNCDQVLPLLSDATDNERAIFANFSTNANEVALHTDQSLLPKREAARASWNYVLNLDGRNGHSPVTMTYHMNRLQSLTCTEDYCVTLNAGERIDAKKVLRRFVYHHPIFTLKSLESQKRWAEISGVNRTHFCGAYWHNGFHEDGVNSALRVAKALGVEA